jgi:hypothetical protein
LDSQSTVAAALATSTGCRSEPSSTAVPIRTREVSPASAPSMTKASGVRSMMRSVSHTECAPAASARRANSTTVTDDVSVAMPGTVNPICIVSSRPTVER